MKLFRSTDEIPVEHPTVTIYSDPGAGKTTLGYGAEEPLNLDADLGAHRAKNRRDTMQPENWKDIEEIVDGKRDAELKATFGKTFADYKTVVIDTAGRALDFLALDVIDKNARHGSGGGTLSQQGWGALKGRFLNFKNALVGKKKNLVFLCHGKEDRKGDSRIVRPDVQGSSLSELLKSSDILGFMHLVGKDRVIEWAPSDEWLAKSPGWGSTKVPDCAKEPYFLASIQAKARADLGKMSEAHRAAASQVVELLDAIEKAVTVDDLNTMLKNRDEIPAVVRAQIRPALLSRAKGLGAVLENGIYVVKAA